MNTETETKNITFTKGEVTIAHYFNRTLAVEATIGEGTGLCYHSFIASDDDLDPDDLRVTHILSGYSFGPTFSPHSPNHAERFITAIAAIADWNKPFKDVQEEAGGIAKLREALKAAYSATE